VVAAAARIKTVPRGLIPPLSQIEAQSNLGQPPSVTGCFAYYGAATVPTCAFGDLHATHTMVLYGDSHAAMWFQALNDIATRTHWKLFVLSKIGCPAALLSTHAPDGIGDWAACDQWHQFAVRRINQIDPDLLLVSQEIQPKPDDGAYTPTQWRRGLESFFSQVKAPNAQRVLLGNIPFGGGPDCILQHMNDIQVCSTRPTRSSLQPFNKAEQQATRSSGASYVNVIPWFCTSVCSSIIGDYSVYANRKHVAVGYTRFLEGALTETLHLQS
jgi:hypothetical protein